MIGSVDTKVACRPSVLKKMPILAKGLSVMASRWGSAGDVRIDRPITPTNVVLLSRGANGTIEGSGHKAVFAWSRTMGEVLKPRGKCWVFTENLVL